MPRQRYGARTNTVGGQRVVVTQMSNHLQALANIKPQINFGPPASREKYLKVHGKGNRPKNKHPHQPHWYQTATPRSARSYSPMPSHSHKAVFTPNFKRKSNKTPMSSRGSTGRNSKRNSISLSQASLIHTRRESKNGTRRHSVTSMKSIDHENSILAKTMQAVRSIKRDPSAKRIDDTEPETCQIGLNEQMIQRRLVREKMQRQEHRLRLIKMYRAINDLNNRSICDRKRNQFDCIGNPVLLFRNKKKQSQKMEYLGDSHLNGRKELMPDLQFSSTMSQFSNPHIFYKTNLFFIILYYIVTIN